MPDTSPAHFPHEAPFWTEVLLHQLYASPLEAEQPLPANNTIDHLNALWEKSTAQGLPASRAFTLHRHCYPSEVLALKLYLQIQPTADQALECLLANTDSLSTLLIATRGQIKNGFVRLEVAIDNRACLHHKHAILGYLCDLLKQLGPASAGLVADASLPLGEMSLLEAERETGFNLQPSNQISFRLHAEHLSTRQKHAHASLATHIAPALKRFKSQLRQPDLEQDVRQKILQFLPETGANLDQVAEQLQISPRHLRRKLTEAGTSYEQLYEQTRKSQAHYLMSETTMSLTEIAYELGFNDPSSLTRACKRWFGSSPSLYRETLQA